ncbi:hypothetical protein [Streptomyces sp. MNP-20]|uniref:terpene synthase family protein n=1 Tax=Streptomyces sp. MNP-20 TaxID=2721165 RepID=UPI001554C7D4|nr:hypothetical protein [Streptomyces sp. MNP-20]
MTAEQHLALWNPIAVEIHPEAEQINERANDFVLHHLIGKDDAYRDWLGRTGFGRLAATWFPYAELERVQLAADLISGWGFVMDDLIDDPHLPRDAVTVRLNRLLRLLDAPQCPPLDDDPLALALADARTRLVRYATPTQIRRFAWTWRLWFFGGAWERAQRALGGPQDLGQATALRLYNVGIGTSTSFCEIAGDYHLDSAELTAPAVRALTEMTWILVAWDNDIFSLPKDLTHDVAEANLTLVLARHYDEDPAKALIRAVDLRNQVMALFLRLRDRIRPGASPALALYLRDLGLQIAGYSHFWHTSSREREGVDSRYAELFPHIGVDHEADDRDPGPAPPVPAIAWWWECLDDHPRT